MIDLLVNLALNLGCKIEQKSTQEAPKSIKKGIENMMQVGLGFGALLERFFEDCRAELGGKLGPTGHQNRKKIEEK